MTRALVLESVGDEGVQQVATLTEGETVIGREPTDGIAISFGAISREHGKFLRIRQHWFYQDLGSTNGSWLNGDTVPADQWRLVRSNDYLQLADKAVRLRETDTSTAGALEMGLQRSAVRSLILFTRGQFADEFPIPEFGRALVVGGAQAQVEIQGDLFENPALVVERRSSGVVAYVVESQVGTTLNGAELTQTEEIRDRDILAVKEHLIIFNDPPVLSTGGLGAGFAAGGGGTETGLKSWGVEGAQPELVPHGASHNAPGRGTADPLISSSSSESARRPSRSSQFGRLPDQSEISHDETVAIESGRFQEGFHGIDRRPSSPYSYDETNEYSFSSTEDRITIIVGILLLILLFVLVIWWVFLV
jgi:pSer/pThr/pTyr-binding forkhead associated (FHA) protein